MAAKLSPLIALRVFVVTLIAFPLGLLGGCEAPLRAEIAAPVEDLEIQLEGVVGKLVFDGLDESRSGFPLPMRMVLENTGERMAIADLAVFSSTALRLGGKAADDATRIPEVWAGGVVQIPAGMSLERSLDIQDAFSSIHKGLLEVTWTVPGVVSSTTLVQLKF